ncbi:MAG: aminotransferase class I/II-fold pyridoxal phosphate-dependent enzyme, partial [Bacillota bacterium]|nr:aminotransferase class I/II-fold pyridoxal phosphate-dependent enzyme [Bacillota bacterium]
PTGVINACAVVRDYTSICPSYLSERVSSAVLENRAAFLTRSLSLANTNFNLVKEWMAANSESVSWVSPEGGVVCFPAYASPLASERLCSKLAEERGVLLVPGTCFDVEGRFRLGFGYDTEKLREGLSRLESFLRTL